MNTRKRSNTFFPVTRRSLCLVVLAAFAMQSTACVILCRYPKTRIARIQIMELEGALQLFHDDIIRYPTAAEGLDALVKNPEDLKSWKGPYLTKLTKPEIPKDPWGRSYVYRCPGQHGAYDLFSYGADGIEDGEEKDITSWDTVHGR